MMAVKKVAQEMANEKRGCWHSISYQVDGFPVDLLVLSFNASKLAFGLVSSASSLRLRANLCLVVVLFSMEEGFSFVTSSGILTGKSFLQVSGKE